MSTFRLISMLRSSLLTNRIVLTFSRMLFRSNLNSYVPNRTQPICLFSSSRIFHARHRDKIDANITENLNEEEEEDEDADSDQVR
jgi:hypothetical protein